MHPDISQRDLVAQARFLLDRLNDFDDWSQDKDDLLRNWCGHVDPARARLGTTVAKFEQEILSSHSPTDETIEARNSGIEEAARYVEGAGGVIPGASVFAPLVSGNNMPCMSGDARDRLHPNKRRYFDDATNSLSRGIRALKAGRSEA